MTVTSGNTESNRVDWQRPLKNRRIYHVALEAGWEFQPLHSPEQNGWSYPVHDLKGRITGKRWKNMNSRANPKYFWSQPQASDNRFPYYILPGTAEAIHYANGRAFLANGEPGLLSYRAAGILNSFCTLNGETAIPGDFPFILKTLGISELIYFFDKDDAGETAAKKVADLLRGTDISYLAIHLPEDLAEKADVNDWWIRHDGSAHLFQEELFLRLDNPAHQFLKQAANTPPKETVSHFIEGEGQTDNQNYTDLPAEFYAAIVQTLAQDYGLQRFKGNGFSNNCRCPHKDHEHDKTSPAGSWHRNGHFFTCHKCGRSYNAIETGKALGIEWRDFIEDKTPKKHKKRARIRLAKKEQTPEHDIVNVESPDYLTDIPVDETDYYTAPPPVPAISGVMNVLNAHSQVYGHMRHYSDEIIMATLDRNEQGDALMLREMFRDKLLYDHAQKSWYIWQGHRWQRDSEETLSLYLMEYVGGFYRERSTELFSRANKTHSTAEAAHLKRMAERLHDRAFHISKSGVSRSILSIVAMYMGMGDTKWDSNPMLLGVQNGVVDLTTGQFRNGRPADYIRSCSPVTYDERAEAPLFENFMHEILGNGDTVQFMQRLLGYGVTGLNKEHILPIFYGRGRNGKDTLLNILREVLGFMATPGFNDVLISNGRHNVGRATPEIYDLLGRRMVWATETDISDKLNVNQVKMLTGSETLRARPLYGNPVEFTATHLLMLSTNHIPQLPAKREDYAIWKRLLLVEFPYSFVEEPQNEMERPIDYDLGEKLKKELPGILNWLLQGLKQWQENGLKPPESVRIATEEAAGEQDIIGDFLEEICEEADDAQVGASDFYSAYHAWADLRHIRKPMTRTAFGRLMSKQYKKQHTVNGKVYMGIRLKC